MFLSIPLLKVCHVQEKSIVLYFCLKEKNMICDKNIILVHCTRTEISLDLVSKFEQLSHATEQVFRVKKTRDFSIKLLKYLNGYSERSKLFKGKCSNTFCHRS